MPFDCIMFADVLILFPFNEQQCKKDLRRTRMELERESNPYWYFDVIMARICRVQQIDSISNTLDKVISFVLY